MRDCRQQAAPPSTKICYHYEQVGHMRVNCPLLVARPDQVPTPATLRITDGQQGRANSPSARCYTFQLTTKEGRAAKDVVTSIFPFIIFSFIFWYDYVYYSIRYLLSAFIYQDF